MCMLVKNKFIQFFIGCFYFEHPVLHIRCKFIQFCYYDTFMVVLNISHSDQKGE
jgi:hypothetical protein